MVATQSNSGVESQNVDDLSVDSNVIDPKADRLGYAPFARHLADSICKMAFARGFVIAVYGPWNSGKSTLLNFIVHYLKQKPESEQPIIVPFNPWLVSGNEDITRRFFEQTQSVLNEQKFVPKGLKERLAGLANIVSQIPLPYAQAGSAVATLFDDKQKDASDLKEEVEKSMLQTHPRIVVAIDDIDRLDPEEIRNLFRVIKAFPNFNDIVYLLFCDQEIVSKALAETPDESGEEYLDKLIQITFKLPIPAQASLRRLLFEQLDTVLADTPKQLFAQTHWEKVYFEGIDHFITKLSDSVRLTNNLRVTYPAVKGEVNSVDFIAVESLRVFCPMIYDIVRLNPKAFAGNPDNEGFLGFTVENLKALHNSWMDQVQAQDREPVKRLLLRLFPKLEGVWGNTHYGAQQELTWRRQLRICSLEIFPNYFRLALPEDDLPNSEIKVILALARNALAFGENLVELSNQKRPDGTTEVRKFLERLEDYTEKEIPLDCIPSIVQAFFDVGDQLLRPEDEACGMFDFGNDVRIGRIIWQLLRKLEEPARFEVLKEAMSNSNARSIIVREVGIFGQQQGKYGADEPSLEEEWLISAKHLKELEELALKRVQDAAQENSLLQTPGLPQILYYWRQWTSEEEVKQWVQQVSSDDEGLLKLLEKFLGKTFSQSASDQLETSQYRFDLKWLELYLDPLSVIDRLRSLDDQIVLTQEQKTAISQFIQEFEERLNQSDSQ